MHQGQFGNEKGLLRNVLLRDDLGKRIQMKRVEVTRVTTRSVYTHYDTYWKAAPFQHKACFLLLFIRRSTIYQGQIHAL